MTARTVRIRAVGDYYAEPGDSAVDLKPLVIEASGENVRRISRFIQLALVGAGRCVATSEVPVDTAVYLASGCGDIEVAADVMQDMLLEGEAIRPISFVNAVSNSACFYVAKRYGLKARSCFVSRAQASFQSALQLAWLDMQVGQVSSALVGSVDIIHHPLELHRRRLHVEPDTAVGEGSHWLWLTTDPIDKPELLAVEFFNSREAFGEWLEGMQQDYPACLVCDDVLHERAFYPTQAGAVISDYLRMNFPEQHLIHIHGDTEDRYAAVMVRR